MLDIAGLQGKRKLVIGDGFNDFELFATATEDDVKVAMGNAPDELKDAADWVTSSVHEDGFAVAMERYGLVS